MKNSAGQGGCYPQRPKVKVDNTLQDLQNSSYSTKAVFNIALLFIQNISPFLKEFCHFALCFFPSPKITQPRPQVFWIMCISGMLTEYWSILPANMATDSRPIYRLRLDRVSVDTVFELIDRWSTLLAVMSVDARLICCDRQSLVYRSTVGGV